MTLYQSGWILNKIAGGVLPAHAERNFAHLYIASLYWVITSFSSVGYGDIAGGSTPEYGF